MNPCACCGHLVLPEPPGSGETCPICLWTDDALQLEFATTLMARSNAPTLQQAQRYYAEYGASDPRRVSDSRLPYSDEPLEPSWRPIDERRDTFESAQDGHPRRAPATDFSLYYWRPAFWRRRRG